MTKVTSTIPGHILCPPQDKILTKEAQWEDMAKEIDSWTDIDAEIKETIIILNLLGFTPDRKKLFWGNDTHPYPSIKIINVQNIDITIQGLGTLCNEKRDIENAINQYDTHIHQELEVLYKKLEIISKQIRRFPYSHLLPLLNLLGAFYRKQPIAPDRMLVLDYCYLQSLGADWQVTRNDKQKLEKMREYQEEMRQFTDFLIEHSLATLVSTPTV